MKMRVQELFCGDLKLMSSRLAVPLKLFNFLTLDDAIIRRQKRTLLLKYITVICILQTIYHLGKESDVTGATNKSHTLF